MRDLNDHINKLLREKQHWEGQDEGLGGTDYFVSFFCFFNFIYDHIWENQPIGEKLLPFTSSEDAAVKLHTLCLCKPSSYPFPKCSQKCVHCLKD